MLDRVNARGVIELNLQHDAIQLDLTTKIVTSRAVQSADDVAIGAVSCTELLD